MAGKPRPNSADRGTHINDGLGGRFVASAARPSVLSSIWLQKRHQIQEGAQSEQGGPDPRRGPVKLGGCQFPTITPLFWSLSGDSPPVRFLSSKPTETLTSGLIASMSLEGCQYLQRRLLKVPFGVQNSGPERPFGGMAECSCPSHQVTRPFKESRRDEGVGRMDVRDGHGKLGGR